MRYFFEALEDRTKKEQIDHFLYELRQANEPWRRCIGPPVAAHLERSIHVAFSTRLRRIPCRWYWMSFNGLPTTGTK